MARRSLRWRIAIVVIAVLLLFASYWLLVEVQHWNPIGVAVVQVAALLLSDHLLGYPLRRSARDDPPNFSN